jgi:hypothetical protein
LSRLVQELPSGAGSKQYDTSQKKVAVRSVLLEYLRRWDDETILEIDMPSLRQLTKEVAKRDSFGEKNLIMWTGEWLQTGSIAEVERSKPPNVRYNSPRSLGISHMIELGISHRTTKREAWGRHMD